MQQIRANLVISNYFKLVQIGSNFNKQEFWQKGNVENANKLVRFYLPKGTDFENVSNTTLRRIQKELNARPRKNLISALL